METIDKKKLLDYLQKQQDFWRDHIEMHPSDKNNDIHEGLSGGYHNAHEAVTNGNFDTDTRKKRICFCFDFTMKRWMFGFSYWAGCFQICLGPIGLSWWRERRLDI